MDELPTRRAEASGTLSPATGTGMRSGPGEGSCGQPFPTHEGIIELSRHPKGGRHNSCWSRIFILLSEMNPGTGMPTMPLSKKNATMASGTNGK